MARPSTPLNLGTVEAVLESLRRGQLHRALEPRKALEGAVQQLLSLGKGRTLSPIVDAGGERRTYRIDEVARISGVTVRNIRAYQERGLLPPPERRGRVALFDDTHLARLKIVTSMLDRGYSGAHITEILAAWERGQDLAAVLGLEEVLVGGPGPDVPTVRSRDEVREEAGGEVELAVMVDAGLIELQGEEARVLRPDLLRAFAELREFGVPTKDLTRLYQDLGGAIDSITRRLVDEGVRQIGHRFVTDQAPTTEEVHDLVLTLTRFRELALSSVAATVEQSLDQRVKELLTVYLHQVVAEKPTG